MRTAFIGPPLSVWTLLAIVSAWASGCGPPAARTEAEAPLVVLVVAGDLQHAAPGTAVAVDPVVRLLGKQREPLAGFEVTCEVVQGGGSIAESTATSDADGRASCGKWTLGTVAGLNLLRVSADGFSPATVRGIAENRASTMTMKDWWPFGPRSTVTVDDGFTLGVRIDSTYELATVAATVNGLTIPLSLGPYDQFGRHVWGARFDLAGVPRGPLDLVVTATDVLGNSMDAVFLGVTLDRSPVIRVASPIENLIALTRFQLQATCTDDDPAGCRSLVATIGNVVVTGKDEVSKEIDLARHAGGEGLWLRLVAKDSAGHEKVVSYVVYVEDNPRLSQHFAVDLRGTAWDADDSRVLWVDRAIESAPVLKLLDLKAGTTEVVDSHPDVATLERAYLSPVGAIYLRNSNGKPSLFEWRDGSLVLLASNVAGLRLAGEWAVYQVEVPSAPSANWRRHLVSATSVGLPAGRDLDVATNGDVVFESGGNIFRWRGGSAQQLTFSEDATSAESNLYPVTDGTHVVYRRRAKPYDIVLNHEGTEEVLGSPTVAFGPPVMETSQGYAAAGGQVVYADSSAVGTQIWRYRPGGSERLTFFSHASHIEALASDGSVVIEHPQARRRYLAIPGKPPEDIGLLEGRPVFRSGKLFLLRGPVVLKVRL